ncbi:MAG TPA: hypothetical protein VJP41_06250 [Gaiellaceae bacterium]|nr:hypothetical protein [Gaiellaceae bacterium]
MRVTTLLAIGLVALIVAAGANAGPKRGVEYLFLGQVSATPANGQLSVTVQRGNHAALRAMLGQSVSQTFSYGNHTEFLKWSHGVPAVVQAGAVAVGDYVWIHVRDSAGASLADIEQKDATVVGDHGSRINPPNKPLFLFRGTLTATGGNSVTLAVRGGNRNATRLLIGQSRSQTFTVGDGTIFLLWQGKVPTVISLAQLKLGDDVTIRIRANKRSTLAQVESTPAVHVGDREPFVHKILYLFLGQVSAAPANGQLSVTVQRGNQAALRAMLGQSVSQTFSYGSNTEFLKWSHGVPSIVHAGDVATGDYVWIHVRDTVGASLADIEQTDAGLIGDHGSLINPPSKPLFLFRGTLTATGSNSVTLTVDGGNRRATRLLIGQPRSETFTVGDGTIFLLWQGKVPTVISLARLKLGDNVTVRIRADKRSTLAQVESTPAVHVGDREPA